MRYVILAALVMVACSTDPAAPVVSNVEVVEGVTRTVFAGVSEGEGVYVRVPGLMVSDPPLIACYRVAGTARSETLTPTDVCEIRRGRNPVGPAVYAAHEGGENWEYRVVVIQ